MRLSNRILRMLILFVFVAAAGLVIAQKEPALKKNVVEDLQVDDLPADDGSGLIISWKPLHRSKRIIEYRIYRGVHPDTLFFLQSVQVNVNTGVAADRMFFYDSDGSDFIDISSPGKLRKEKQQDAKSPLYRKIPRDMELAARLSEKYDVYSIVERSPFYYKGVKSFSADVEDSTVYAGYQFKHQNLQATLKPGETYYYSVVAVNERDQFQGYAEPVGAIPLPNPPEPASALYANWLEDTKELTFEWDYPMQKTGIAQYQLHMISSAMGDQYNAVKDGVAIPEGISHPIGMGLVGSGALANYTTIPMPDLTTEQVKNSRFAIQLMKAEGSSFSHLVEARITDSSALPPKPLFSTVDMPNDKGDRLSVIWDLPIAFVTKTTSLNKNNTKLKINYQLNKTEIQKLSNIYFQFFIPGETKPFIVINEFYQDFSLKLNIPDGYDYRKGLDVKITMKGNGEGYENYELAQKLRWDEDMMTLMPGAELWRNGVDVSHIQNVVYRRGVRSPYYTLLKRNTSFDGSLDVTIPYVSRIPRGVAGFNFVKNDTLYTYMGGQRFARALKKGERAKNAVLIPSQIDFSFDKDKEMLINVSLFRDEQQRELDELEKEVEEAKAKVAKLDAETDAELLAEAQAELEGLEARWALYQENPMLQEALKRKGNSAWMRYIASVREAESRHHSYQVVKTDGHGLYKVSDPDTTKTGDVNFHIPVANWFSKDKYATLFAVLIYGALVVAFVTMAKRGKDLYIRPIAGLDEIDNAVGRATEMGRPMLYCMGSGGLADVATLASMSILAQVAKRAAEYDTRMIVPAYDYIVLPVVQEIVRDAHYAVGRPDSYDKNNIFFLTNSQFAYVAGVNGIMVREKMATNFFLGYFSAEALLMTETGNTVGAVQIAGSDATTQIPFFITTCDYTLIGEELYAAGAYLNREPMLLGTLKSQDYLKIIIVFLILVGSVLSTLQIMTLLNILPTK